MLQSLDFIIRFLTKLVASMFLFSNAMALETVPITPAEITPSDVFLHVSKVRAELELLRFHMGKPKTKPVHQTLVVQNAAPREVYYQAMTLFDKSSQLSFDHLRVRSARPNNPKSEILPSDVFNVVNQALIEVRKVKNRFGITTIVETPKLETIQTPSDVFVAIVETNQQLNLLLDQRFAPKDVFKQVTQAIGYSARLLANFPNAIRIPESEGLQHGKRPVDVFQRLVGCYENIRMIGEQSGLTMLHLETNITKLEIVPGDVYDIASLILSELAYLQGKLENSSPPRTVYDPGRKFPSHVFQRVSILEFQLKSLSSETKKSPLWLSVNKDPATR